MARFLVVQRDSTVDFWVDYLFKHSKNEGVRLRDFRQFLQGKVKHKPYMIISEDDPAAKGIMEVREPVYTVCTLENGIVTRYKNPFERLDDILMKMHKFRRYSNGPDSKLANLHPEEYGELYRFRPWKPMPYN